MQRWLFGAGTVLLGALLLSISVPRMIAHLLMLPGHAGLERIKTGAIITLDGYDRILRSRDAALHWIELPDARIDLGVTLYLLALSAERLGIDPALALPEARRQLELGLAREPGAAHAWLWLADINQALGDLDRAAKAVRLALLAAPYDVKLAPIRASVAFRLWNDLAADAKVVAARDARTVLTGPGAASFVQLMVENDALGPLREAVASDPALEAKLSELLAQQDATG